MHHISKYSLLLSSFLFCGIGFILFVNPIEKIATFSWLISLGFFLKMCIRDRYDAFDGFDLYFVNVRGQGESPMKVGLPDLEGAVQDVDDILKHFQLRCV